MRKLLMAGVLLSAWAPTQVFAQQVAETIILEDVRVLSLQYVDPSPNLSDIITLVQIELDQALDERCPAPRLLELKTGNDVTWNEVIVDELRQARDSGEPLASLGYTFIIAHNERFCTLFAVKP